MYFLNFLLPSLFFYFCSLYLSSPLPLLLFIFLLFLLPYEPTDPLPSNLSFILSSSIKISFQHFVASSCIFPPSMFSPSLEVYFMLAASNNINCLSWCILYSSALYFFITYYFPWCFSYSAKVVHFCNDDFIFHVSLNRN